MRAELRTTATPGVLVQAVLTFRQSIWVFEEDQSLVAEHLPAFRFEQWNDSPVELPSLSDLFSSTNHTCVAATPHTLASTESRRVFADEALEQIRLVGVIEKTKGESRRVRRGIFRGPSGELVVAAHNAEVSSSGLRLVSLGKSRGVLYSEKLGSTVMRLEPTLMSGASYGHGSVSAALIMIKRFLGPILCLTLGLTMGLTRAVTVDLTMGPTTTLCFDLRPGLHLPCLGGLGRCLQ